MENKKRKQQAYVLRVVRKLHRVTGVALFLFFFVIAVTGLLLGWKKNFSYLQAPSHKGVSANAADWLPMDSLQQKAVRYLKDSVSADLSPKLDRLDLRPDKGMVKVLFADHYWGLQLDCTTGALLHIERRRSDFIEHLHDATLVDNQLATGGIIKLVYTTIMGLALVLFTVTGFWLWYGPRRMRHAGKIAK